MRRCPKCFKRGEEAILDVEDAPAFIRTVTLRCPNCNGLFRNSGGQFSSLLKILTFMAAANYVVYALVGTLFVALTFPAFWAFGALERVLGQEVVVMIFAVLLVPVIACAGLVGAKLVPVWLGTIQKTQDLLVPLEEITQDEAANQPAALNGG